MEKTESIWLDGKLVPWDDARFHFFTHSLHYGLGVFEGIRCYRLQDGRSAIFRLEDHIHRLFDSARMGFIKTPHTPEAVEQACRDVVKKNGLDECYIRPLVWMGEGPLGIGSTSNVVRTAIGAFKWNAYLGEGSHDKGVRCAIASICRPPHNSSLAKAKIAGQYVNSILAKREAARAGCDEAILLDGAGRVAEGTGENLFIVRDGVLKTPSPASPILLGITRDSVLTLARENAAQLGLTSVREEDFAKDELFIADEVFLTGTAVEIVPVREIEGRTIGAGVPGKVTRALQSAYQDAVRGRESRHAEWRAVV